MLGLIQELSYNRDCRMGFSENTCISMQYLECMISLVQKCLTIVREFDLTNPSHCQTAMSLLKRAMKICLNLGLNEIMNQKRMELLVDLRNKF